MWKANPFAVYKVKIGLMMMMSFTIPDKNQVSFYPGTSAFRIKGSNIKVKVCAFFSSFVDYNKEQFTPTRLEGSEEQVCSFILFLVLCIQIALTAMAYNSCSSKILSKEKYLIKNSDFWGWIGMDTIIFIMLFKNELKLILT